MQFLNQGVPRAINLSAAGNGSGQKSRKKKAPNNANISLNPAKIIEVMKRQNLNGDTLHKLLISNY